MDTSRGRGWSWLAPWSGRAGLARSLVILGAFLSVFALHTLTSAQDAPSVVVSSVNAPAVSESLEQVAMVAPVVLVSDASSNHHTLPCAATLAGSVLLLSAWLILRRQRFGDEPRSATLRRAVHTPRRRHRAAPQLAQLCVLRT